MCHVVTKSQFAPRFIPRDPPWIPILTISTISTIRTMPKMIFTILQSFRYNLLPFLPFFAILCHFCHFRPFCHFLSTDDCSLRSRSISQRRMKIEEKKNSRRKAFVTQLTYTKYLGVDLEQSGAAVRQGGFSIAFHFPTQSGRFNSLFVLSTSIFFHSFCINELDTYFCLFHLAV